MASKNRSAINAKKANVRAKAKTEETAKVKDAEDQEDVGKEDVITDQDEYYTQLPDIEYELQHYKKHFNRKVVYCNCDDPLESNFFIYFVKNFKTLGLKKLITTCYDGSPVAGRQLLFPFIEAPKVELKRVAYKIEVTDVEDFSRTEGKLNFHDVEEALRNGSEKARLEKLEGDKKPYGLKGEMYGAGDFRSRECVELLKEADIAVTNPPFSLIREYITQMLEYKKKFLIIGPQDAFTYQCSYPSIEKGEIRLGWEFRDGNADFATPDTNRHAKEGKLLPNGLIRFRNCYWFTNLENGKRNPPLELTAKYTPEKYPKYENYDAIRVESLEDIPCDYYGVMGVPLTFLTKHCPEQFELVGCSYAFGRPKFWDPNTKMSAKLNGVEKWKCLFIRRKVKEDK